MNHALVGAAFPFALFAVYYTARRCRASVPLLLATPAAMAIGVVWALVPDLPRLVGQTALYRRLADDPRTNIFFWHYTLDRVETYSVWLNVGFLLLLFALLAIAWRELRVREGGA